MWIAKNSITGQTYGIKFASIYECQSFIDMKLCVLEYEFQRCFALEKDTLERLKNRSIMEIISDNIKDFINETGIEENIKTVVDFSLSGKKQKEIDVELHRLACVRWQKNNVIRCYNIEQKRFADGFDF